MKNLCRYYILGVFILFCQTFTSFSQNGESNHWYFGANAGLNFDYGATNSPNSVTNGECNTYEGCSSISDSSGSLLFYTDGLTVWNAIHAIMLNGSGLLANSSSTQSALIIPKPQSSNIYYIFTVDANLGLDGFRYSEVDMTLGGGLGGVDSTTKNTLLFTPSLEKIAAVKHTNGIDIWVVGHQWNNSNFIAYLVTSSGVQAGYPVITTIGHNYMGGYSYDTRGYMKFSPSGNKLALAIEGQDKFELYDFNTTTGVLSNLITLIPPATIGTFNDAHGVEFSANGKVLYGTRRWSPMIFQWNLNAGTTADIQASCLQVGDLVGNDAGALQLGLDEKIYVARDGKAWLARIENPSVIGTACGFTLNAVNLDPKICREGLPSFMASYFAKKIEVSISKADVVCFGGSNGVIFLNPTTGTPPYTYNWNIGDTTNYISNLISGMYYCTVTDSEGFNFSDSVFISEPTEIEISTIINPETNSGVNDGSILNSVTGGVPPYSFSWNNGETEQSLENISFGNYSLTISDSNSCFVDYTYAVFLLNLEKTDVSCFGGFDGAISLNTAGGQAPYSYSWSDSSSANEINNLSIGEFQVTVSDIMGNISIDSFTITQPDEIQLSVVVTPETNPGASDGSIINTVSGGVPPYVYNWNTGDTTLSIENIVGGEYYFKVTDSNGCDKDSNISVSILNNVFEIENSNGAILFQNTPNPFQNYTTINYYLPRSSEIELSVYNVLGERIKLLEKGRKSNGIHSVSFSTMNQSSGIYFYKLEIEGQEIVKRMDIK